MNYKEEFEKYSKLDKEDLIKIIISTKEEKYAPDECMMYTPGTDTSLRCIYCGKSQYEHYNYCIKKL